MGWKAAQPTLHELLEFLRSLVVGSHEDCGCNCRQSALSVLSAIKFAAWKLGLSSLSELLGNPLILSWQRCADSSKTFPKEAVPLPLDLVRNLEQAVAVDAGEDTAFLRAILLMCWAGLRFSDLQRINLSQLQIADGVVRGLCWKTKSRKTGMVFGCLVRGCSNLNWGLQVARDNNHACQAS